MIGWKTLFNCEINPFCRRILNYYWPNAHSYEDITTTDFTIYSGKIDVLSGGFPCQDASIAKQYGEGQQGLQGERTGLFFHLCRAISEIRPRYVVAENVENILRTNGGRDFTEILTQLAGMGYNAEWRVCRASDVGAPHHRARLYLVAYSNSIRFEERQTFFSYVVKKTSSVTWKPYGTSIQISRANFWESEPPILCVDDGIPSKLVRQSLHAYGNAVVPQVVYEIFKAINDQIKEQD
ncbi:DNA cytosine methyltransferase [Sphingobacterium spiritivorum]